MLYEHLYNTSTYLERYTLFICSPVLPLTINAVLPPPLPRPPPHFQRQSCGRRPHALLLKLKAFIPAARPHIYLKLGESQSLVLGTGILYFVVKYLLYNSTQKASHITLRTCVGDMASHQAMKLMIGSGCASVLKTHSSSLERERGEISANSFAECKCLLVYAKRNRV